MYHKNGVITEDRFQRMTTAQWLFHYYEVCDIHGEEKIDLKESLSDIELSIQAFYMLVDKDNGQIMMDSLNDIKKNRYKERNENMSESKDDNIDPNDKYAGLRDDDRELLEFADTLPKVIDLPQEFKHEGRFILPTADRRKLIEEYNTAEEFNNSLPSGDTEIDLFKEENNLGTDDTELSDDDEEIEVIQSDDEEIEVEEFESIDDFGTIGLQ